MKRSVAEVIPGAKFGKLMVVERLPRKPYKKPEVSCICDCGSQVLVPLYSLARGGSRSCGCMQGRKNHDVVPGAKFNRLTVIEKLPRVWIGSRYSYRIRCLCECGKETVQEITTVVKGLAASCGCKQFDAVRRIAREKSVTASGTGQVVPGARFGRLTVIARIEKDGKLTDSVHCRCDCGNETSSGVDSLCQRKTKSCGCLQSELLTKRNKESGKYKAFSSRCPLTYNAWVSMFNRCSRPNSVGYAIYGARGVLLCQGLRDDPRNLKRLIGVRPSKGHSIDRFPIYNGNYTCGKCDECVRNGWEKNIRWATAKEQGLNKGNNVWIEAFGKRMTKSQWVEASGLSWTTFSARLKRGWTVEKALTTPDKKGNCYRPDGFPA